MTAYAILGYDLLIGDAEVAAMYQKVVGISDDSDFKSSDFKLEIKSNHLRFRFRMKAGRRSAPFASSRKWSEGLPLMNRE